MGLIDNRAKRRQKVRVRRKLRKGERQEAKNAIRFHDTAKE